VVAPAKLNNPFPYLYFFFGFVFKYNVANSEPILVVVWHLKPRKEYPEKNNI
jgi:hypothetical protein